MFYTYAFSLGLLIGFIFCLYERNLHKKYRDDLAKEKLIADFSNTRMQTMRMLHVKELDVNSCYFNFMIKATSYSIRALYFYDKNIEKGLYESDILNKLLVDLVDPRLKEEFNGLSSEQKDMFVKVAVNVLTMHTQGNYLRKLLLNMYISKAKLGLLKLVVALLKFVSDTKDKQELSYIEDINHSYDLNRYAFA